MSSLIDRLKGNGEPWTFKELIEELEKSDRRKRALEKISDMDGEHYRDVYDEGLWWRAVEIAKEGLL